MIAATDRIGPGGRVARIGRVRRWIVLAMTAGVLLAACSNGSSSTAPSLAADAGASPAASGSAAPVTVKLSLQLQWYPQAQFAGYYAAREQGYFAAEGLDVTLLDGGATIAPQVVASAPDGPEFAVAWVPKVLQARAGGSDLVNIAQIFQRSGTLAVSWKDSNIITPADLKGRRVGVWDFGNEFEVVAGARKAGLERGTDYTTVVQDADMSLLLSRQVDVAEAMIYNEYAQLLESLNPQTRELVKPDELNVINWIDFDSAMLQDSVYARAAWLAEPGHEDIAVRFLKASFKGWIYCRANPDDCVQYTVDAGSTLGAGHQRWMLNEINPLIWPSTDRIGMMDPALWQQTVDVAVSAGIITTAPSADAYRTDLVTRALEGIADDVVGADFVKGVVEITPGGS